jgi:hypothetical protein
MRLPWLATLLFFTPVYVARIFKGTFSDTYEEMPHLPLGWLPYTCNFILLAIFAFFLMNQNVNKYRLSTFLKTVFIISIVGIGQLIFISTIMGSEVFFFGVYFSRVLLLLIVNFIFILFFFDKAIFIKVFDFFSIVTLVVSFGAFIFHMTLGSDIQLHIGYGVPRVQGLLSEPSALAGPLSAYANLCLLRRKWFSFTATLACVFLSHSIIVYAALAISVPFTLMYFRFTKGYTHKVIIVSSLVIAAVGSGFYLVPNIFGSTNYIALNAVFKAFSSLWQYGYVGSETLGVLLSHQLDRVAGLIITIMELIKDDALFIGYGLNGSSYLFVERFGDTKAWGLIAYLIASYGIVLGPLLLGVIFFLLCRLLRQDLYLGIIGMSFFIAVLGNSAGGIILYGVVVTLAFRALCVLPTKKFYSERCYKNVELSE